MAYSHEGCFKQDFKVRSVKRRTQELVLKQGAAFFDASNPLQFLIREGGQGVLCIVFPSEGLVRLAVMVHLHVAQGRGTLSIGGEA